MVLLLGATGLLGRNVLQVLLERGNGRYLLTGECLTLKEFFRIQARVGGYRQLCIALPNWMAGLLGVIGSTLRFLRIKTELYPHNVNQLLYEEWYSSARARISSIISPFRAHPACAINAAF